MMTMIFIFNFFYILFKNHPPAIGGLFSVIINFFLCLENTHPSNYYLLGDEGYLGKELHQQLKQMGYERLYNFAC